MKVALTRSLAAITGALLAPVLLRIADLVERPQADQA
jgi:hypothetical protein